MEDFVAGFNETADQYPSAADWITQHLDALPAADRDGHALKYLAILSRQRGDLTGSRASNRHSARG